MTDEIRVILTFLLAFLSSLYVLPNLSHIAKRIGLVDVPNERKIHVTPRPLVGGIGVVVSATFSCLIFATLEGMRGYFAGLSVLLLIGFFDDYHEIGHRKKFIAQIIATFLMIYLSNVQLANFGNLLGFGAIQVPNNELMLIAMTVFAVVGVTNAVNMVDGIDGLAGGTALISLLAFGVLASLSGNSTLTLLSLATAGAVLGFLQFNWSPSVLFLGDAGSLCLGFALAFLSVALSQGESAQVAPVITLLVVAVPISDALVVMTKRVLQGRSPFKADRTHLHHILVKHEVDGQKPVKVILLMSLIMCNIGIAGFYFQIPEWILFAIFLVYFVMNWHADRLVGGAINLSSVFTRHTKPQKCPTLVHSVFQRVKNSKIFRGADRYGVECKLQISYCNNPVDVMLDGRIINISRTGFMAHINGLGMVCQRCLVTITFPVENGVTVHEIPVEHLWLSNNADGQYHGFKFLDLGEQQSDVLLRFIKSQLL